MEFDLKKAFGRIAGGLMIFVLAVSCKAATIRANAAPSDNDRSIYVNIATQKVAVIRNGEMTPDKVFLCSTGKNNNTPIGVFNSEAAYYDWHGLYGNVYSYGAIRVKGSILIHSVPYSRMNFGTMETEEYNKLGAKASLGCIRVTQRDLNYLLSVTSTGVPIVIFNDPLIDWTVTETHTTVDESTPTCFDPSINWGALLN